VRCDVFIDNETLLLTDFVDLKIKSAQSFRDAYRNRVYVHVFIGGECSYVYKYLYL
jgi:hypothetical protein